jgi:hypothetical protein
MAKSTFSGPVRSLAGLYSSGYNSVVSLTANTTITVAAHAGRPLLCNDADGVFTLPSIVVTEPADKTDPNQLCNLGAQFTFIVVTAATDMDIATDGTDKFVGGSYTGIDDSAAGKTFISGASNDTFTQNGTTKGGLVGSIVVFTAMASAKYHVAGQLLGSGTLVTPFADS